MKERFVSASGYSSKQGAERILQRIREAHPASSGWTEIEAGFELHPDGWHAYREHEHSDK